MSPVQYRTHSTVVSNFLGSHHAAPAGVERTPFQIQLNYFHYLSTLFKAIFLIHALIIYDTFFTSCPAILIMETGSFLVLAMNKLMANPMMPVVIQPAPFSNKGIKPNKLFNAS